MEVDTILHNATREYANRVHDPQSDPGACINCDYTIELNRKGKKKSGPKTIGSLVARLPADITQKDFLAVHDAREEWNRRVEEIARNAGVHRDLVETEMYVGLYDLQREEDVVPLSKALKMDPEEVDGRLNFSAMRDLALLASRQNTDEGYATFQDNYDILSTSKPYPMSREEYTRRLSRVPLSILRMHSFTSGLWGIYSCVSGDFYLYREMLEGGYPFMVPARCDLSARYLRDYLECDSNCVVNYDYWRTKWNAPLPIVVRTEPMPSPKVGTTKKGRGKLTGRKKKD